MKKPSYPNPDEIQKLLVIAERRNALRAEIKESTAVIRAKQAARRRMLCDYLGLHDENSRLTSHYETLYARASARSRPDSEISEATRELKGLLEGLTELETSLGRLDSEFSEPALKICARVECAKRAEFTGLIDEIAAALRPFSMGDEATARQLAEDTPAAAAIQSQLRRCSPTLSGPDDLISPLRAALEFATSNSPKK